MNELAACDMLGMAEVLKTMGHILVEAEKTEAIFVIPGLPPMESSSHVFYYSMCIQNVKQSLTPTP